MAGKDVLTVLFLGTRDGLCNWRLIDMLMMKWKEFCCGRSFKVIGDKNKYLTWFNVVWCSFCFLETSGLVMKSLSLTQTNYFNPRISFCVTIRAVFCIVWLHIYLLFQNHCPWLFQDICYVIEDLRWVFLSWLNSIDLSYYSSSSPNFVTELWSVSLRECLDTRQPGRNVWASPTFSKEFNTKACSNVLKLFDICLESPSDSEKYFDFVVDKFSELVFSRKSRCLRHFELFVAKPRQWETHRILTEFLIQTLWEYIFEVCVKHFTKQFKWPVWSCSWWIAEHVRCMLWNAVASFSLKSREEKKFLPVYRCSFVWTLRVVYFLLKHSCLYNKIELVYVLKTLSIWLKIGFVGPPSVCFCSLTL